MLGPIAFDAAFMRISMNIPQGSVVLSCEVVLESEVWFTDPATGYRHYPRVGGDRRLVIRTQLVDHDNVWWGLWAGPIHGLTLYAILLCSALLRHGCWSSILASRLLLLLLAWSRLSLDLALQSSL